MRVATNAQEGTKTSPGSLDVPAEGSEATCDFTDATCPPRRALNLIADKWTPLVVWTLRHGTRRYNALKREIPGVSQRMLTQSLRKLEGEGLVSRQVFDTMPPMVEYTLTPLGETMLEPLAAIQRWACTHFQTH